MKAYSNAITELKQLSKFYNSSCHAFSQTEEIIKYRARNGKNSDPDLLFIRPNLFSIKQKFGIEIRSQLRGLIFIRLVSVLETYLIDNLKDIFLINKTFFKQKEEIKFQQEDILSTESMSYIHSKIINNECRKLSSGGYSEIIKYYKSRFHVDLANINPGLSTMEEYHQRRHLLVHGLGKPDKQYREKYNFDGDVLDVDEDYLTQSFKAFQDYIYSVNFKTNKLLESDNNNIKKIYKAYAKYLIILPPEEEKQPNIIKENWNFWVRDDLFAVRDILVNKHFQNNNECEISVKGEPEVLQYYEKQLKAAQKKAHLIVARRLHHYGFSTKLKLEIGSELLDEVRKALPPQPWVTGIHKVVALQLGSTNSIVSEAINILIHQKVFKPQYKGKVLET